MPVKRVYFLLFAKQNLESKCFSLGGSNPGVGGTQFTIIGTALRLSRVVSDWEVFLVNRSPVEIVDAPANLKQVFFDTPEDFLKSFVQEPSSIVVATVSVLKQLPITLLQPIEHCLIAWSHHPFDQDLEILTASAKVRSVVCVGIYQYFSNKTIDSSLSHIQNVFNLPIKDVESLLHINKDQINLVYLGALIPGKNFLEVAKAWQQLKVRFPGTKLHVIGSSATYGFSPESKLVPADQDYAAQILEYIPEQDIHNGEVIFYGNLGKEKFDIIRKCDFAVLNPTGQSEAFPASPLEIMACGVPVIASDDYGMSDCMRFFPELVIDGHEEILGRVEYLVEDPLRYRELQERSIAVAKWFSLQNNQIITRWLRLLNSLLENESLELSPMAPFYGSQLRLWFRRDLKPKLRIIKRSIKRLIGFT